MIQTLTCSSGNVNRSSFGWDLVGNAICGWQEGFDLMPLLAKKVKVVVVVVVAVVVVII